jgi:hypothetical protein
MDCKTQKIIPATALILNLLAFGTQAQVKPPNPRKSAPDSAAILWREPKDIASRNLFYGPGGKAHLPAGKFTFQEEDMAGTSPKFDVIDEDGVRWRVKMGVEARPETAASRLLWAAGYFANEDYFMPVLHVENMPRLHRGRNLVSPEGNVYNVRLKRHSKDEKKIGSWSWAHNPFVGTREWYGLRVLMAVMNNWDLKDNNNSIYRTREDPPEDRYVVTDLGGSFGPAGLDWTRKGKPSAYCKSKLIKSSAPEFVDFQAPAAPAMNYLRHYIDFPELAHRLTLRWIGQGIPRADARWIGDLLVRLSPEQISDAFRAAGYSPDEVEDLTKTLVERIGELEKL